ncbi:MAG: hypothetical protein IJL66_05140 [Lachnospiraceae bacterium]|nr:hypothetical protein [Lachnospiraceae bacterium]
MDQDRTGAAAAHAATTAPPSEPVNTAPAAAVPSDAASFYDENAFSAEDISEGHAAVHRTPHPDLLLTGSSAHDHYGTSDDVSDDGLPSRRGPGERSPLAEFLEDVILEEDILAEAQYKSLDKTFLWLRNLSVLAAFILFFISLFMPHHNLLKGAAYIFGCGAYVFEILLITDAFHKRVPSDEMFMAYCFGPMYLLLAISYLFGSH